MWLSEALEEQIRVLEPSLGRKIKPISKCNIFPQWRALGPLIPSKPTKLLHSPFVPQPAAAWWELAAIPLWCLPWHPWKTCTAPEDPSREGSPSCLAFAKREGSKQDLAQGKSQVGSQHSPCPGNTLELGWAQQPGDSEGKVVAQVEFLILN